MKYRKKLIEVALPLDVINQASAAEKKIHVGTTSNLHAWWARRPLAACRAVVFASLVDDPSNDLPPEKAEKKRRELFDVLCRLVQWESNNDGTVLAAARRLIAESIGADRVLIVDPFCGAGSIPIESQRLGLHALGLDLNPVAVAISKALVEVPPVVSGHTQINPGRTTEQLLLPDSADRFKGFRDDLKHYEERVLSIVKDGLVGLYGKEAAGHDPLPIAWLWCRTVPCTNPGCRALVPLIKSLWLSRTPKNRCWLSVKETEEDGRVVFEVQSGSGRPTDPPITDSGARCVSCATTMSFAEIRAAAMQGEMGFRLTAVVLKSGTSMTFRVGTETEEKLALSCSPNWSPDTSLPEQALGFRVQKYGLTHHSDLFLPRQLAMLSIFAEALSQTVEEIRAVSSDEAYANAVAVYLAIFFDRLVQTNNSLVRWFTHTQRPSKAQPTFDKQTVQMTWDFAEANPLSNSAGGWSTCCKYPQTALNCLPQIPGSGTIRHCDARTMEVEHKSETVFCTDPPYYDNIGYADLSDFFYIWLRRTLRGIYPDAFRTMLVPKQEELIADPSRHQGDEKAAKEFFYSGMQDVFHRMWNTASSKYPTTIFYAFKQSQSEPSGPTVSTGWERMLQALVDGSWAIVGTWPIRTEHENRPRGIGANALASSVVLVCRKRPSTAPTTTHAEFRRLLRKELPDAMKALQECNIAPVDMAQSSIGPGMAIFTRHSKVLEADGNAMSVRTALGTINQALDEVLAEQEGEFDADTRWAIAWFEQFGLDVGAFGQADVLARAKNTAVDGLVEAGIARASGGKVQLLQREELRADWEPSTDKRLTIWEVTQYLIRALEQDGETGAAALLQKLGGLGETARDLAYRLYTICERKKWADEALAYNGLVIAWPELTKLALAERSNKPESQSRLFE